MKNAALVISIYVATISMAVCLKASTRDVTWTKFDEYSELSQREEHKRLKTFLFQLRNSLGQIAVIVAYGGVTTCPDEAQFRASRVRRYLLKSGVPASRMSVVDAGFQRQWTISLFIGSREFEPITAASLNISDGHLDPAQVKMLRSCPQLK